MSTDSFRPSKTAKSRRSFWSLAGLFAKRDRCLDSLQATGRSSSSGRPRCKLRVEQLECRELLSFSSGLVVEQVGTGSTLSATAAPIVLDNYSTSGSLLTSVTLATTGTQAITESGTATTDGLLTDSADGRYLTVTGYNVASG